MAKLLTAKVPFLNATEANFWTQLKTVIPSAPRYVAQLDIVQSETSNCEVRTTTAVAGYVVPTGAIAPITTGSLAAGRGNEIDLDQLILYGVSAGGNLHISVMVN